MRRSERRSVQFHDTKVSKAVKHACQAIAIDETRASHEPALWVMPKAHHTETVEQVWFPGSHADIGGGGKELALADLSLGWMLTRLRSYCPELVLRPFKDWRPERFKDYPNCMGTITPPAGLLRIGGWRRSMRVIKSNRWASPPIWHRGRRALGPQIRTIGEMVHESARERYQRTRGAVRPKDRYEPPNLLAAFNGRNTPIVGLDGEQVPELVEYSITGVVRLQRSTANAEANGKDYATDGPQAKQDTHESTLARGFWVQHQLSSQSAPQEVHADANADGRK